MTLRTSWCALVVAGTLPWAAWQAGQSAAGSQTPDTQVPQQGAHRSHALDTPTHRAYACAQCHARRGAEVTVEGWDPASKTCSSTYCHGGFPGGVPSTVAWQSAAGARLSCRECHGFPPTTGAHPVHTRSDGYAIPCAVCHGGPAWSARHTAGSVFVALQPRAGPQARYADATCSGVACHSNGLGAPRAVHWIDPRGTCRSCHDDETSATPVMSGQHARHFRFGLACADCHGAVVDRAKRIIDYSLHANGSADVKVLSGRYSAGSCQPACHDTRSW